MGQIRLLFKSSLTLHILQISDFSLALLPHRYRCDGNIPQALRLEFRSYHHNVGNTMIHALKNQLLENDKSPSLYELNNSTGNAIEAQHGYQHMTGPKLISLFSGGGGLDLGLEAAGFETVFASDIDMHSCKTLENGKAAAKRRKKPFLQNAQILQADVRNLPSHVVLEAAGVKPGEVDLLAGGPPCQAFSVFGKRLGVNDPRGLLANEYLRLLADIQPKAFIFENVFGLLTIHDGETFKELCKKLEAPGDGVRYTLSVFRLNAADFGVPQFRDRVFIVGSLNGKQITDIPRICAPAADHSKSDNSLPRYRTVADALRGLPPLGSDLANHTGRVHSQRIIDRYEALAHGARDSKTRINKLDPNRPSFTIIVGSDKGGGKGHVHPYEAREVSPRESARMQTFPDWWAFSGTSRHPIRQVGNAVPPLLAAVIGREIMVQIFGLERRPLQQILALLGQEHLFKTQRHRE